ncbi:hypothetical protein VDF70_19885 [Xanthomonas campestris pv. raphani]|uniref:hypothetical protein n=1 Tax=Xanthomonas campestris TaxID=339 RepID=UPI002B236BF6|nr:hypothetical protein [Xanthomonas campestris]MEA9761264.1 hypothetical protein [Xanthomonas campestris pv. raphani]
MNCGKKKRVLIFFTIAWLLFSISFSAVINSIYLNEPNLPSWVDFFQNIASMTGYSTSSGLGYIADIYYALVPLIYPLTAIISHLAILYEDDGQYSDWALRPRDFPQKIGGLALGGVLVIFSILGLTAFAGQGNRYLYIAKEFWSMASNGWIFFAVTGALLGAGSSFIKISLIKNNR